MSAIVAGKSCKKCKKEYWSNFGHPRWYEDVVTAGLPESEEFKEYKKLTKSGMCPACYIKTHKTGPLRGTEMLVKRQKDA